jgi:hypothetical protein
MTIIFRIQESIQQRLTTQQIMTLFVSSRYFALLGWNSGRSILSKFQYPVLLNPGIFKRIVHMFTHYI